MGCTGGGGGGGSENRGACGLAGQEYKEPSGREESDLMRRCVLVIG